MARVTLLLLAYCFLRCSAGPTDQFDITSQTGNTIQVKLNRGKVNYLETWRNDSILSSWPLRYPVYQFDHGDVNNDGVEDIAIGVIKTTRQDKVARKRLFLFTLQNDRIIPLWLGSSLVQPLEDFRIISNKKNNVRTIELEKDSTFSVGEYEWFGFGLSLQHYRERKTSLERARQLLDQ
jgi:hypothetical protein